MKNSFFDSPNYTSLMYLMILLVSIFILFSFVNLTEEMSQINQGITGLAVSSEQNQTNSTLESANQELYSARAYLGYGVAIVIIIVLVSAISIILGRLISKNMKGEFEKQRGLEEELEQSNLELYKKQD